MHKAVAFGLTLLALPAAAVCLNGHPSVRDEYRSSDVVAIVLVVTEHPEPEAPLEYLEGVTYTVRVDEVLRGKPARTLRLFSENSSGRFPMDIGGKYLIFLTLDARRMGVDYCGNSGLLSERAEAVKTVRRLQHTRKAAR